MQAWEFYGNFLISGNFVPHFIDFQGVLRHFCQFLHIFRKSPKDSFSYLIMLSTENSRYYFLCNRPTIANNFTVLSTEESRYPELLYLLKIIMLSTEDRRYRSIKKLLKLTGILFMLPAEESFCFMLSSDSDLYLLKTAVDVYMYWVLMQLLWKIKMADILYVLNVIYWRWKVLLKCTVFWYPLKMASGEYFGERFCMFFFVFMGIVKIARTNSFV